MVTVLKEKKNRIYICIDYNFHIRGRVNRSNKNAITLWK